MNPTIKYTLLEYKQNYSELLAVYLSNYFDVTEGDFIVSELATYQICLDVADYIDKNYKAFVESYDSESLRYPKPEKFQILSIEYSNFNFSAIAKEIISFENASFNQSISQRLLSFDKIISFLENKKLNLKTTFSAVDQKPLFTNNFDDLPENVILKYFTENLVDKNYLDASVLMEFLIVAFQKKIPPTQRFNFKMIKTKAQIIRVFYSYYKNVAGKPHDKQRQYVELLGEYFNGFDTNKLITNFSK